MTPCKPVKTLTPTDMNLPDLPRKNKRLEAKVDSLVAAWLDANYPHPYALEVKIKGGRLKTHQDVFLTKVANGTQPAWKIPDMGKQNKCDIIGGFKYMQALLCTVDGKDVDCMNYNDTYHFNFKL